MTVLDLDIQAVPYTYIIEWSKLGKRYIGARWAKGCHPGDLWTEYFTSSQYVRDFVSIHGDPDIILIDGIFTNARHAMQREKELQLQFNVRNNDAFLNKGIAGVYNHDDPEIRKRHRDSHFGRKFSDETKEKMRVKLKGYVWPEKVIRTRWHKQTDEAKEKVRLFQTGRIKSEQERKNISAALKGKKKSEAHAAKCRVANLGKKATLETRRRQSERMKGKKHGLGYRHTQEAKRKMSQSRTGIKVPSRGRPQPLLVCPHCNKQSRSPTLRRWHFDHCKQKQ